MKVVGSILNGVQIGGFFGLLAAWMSWSNRQEGVELMIFKTLGFSFSWAGLAASFCLGFMSEPKRAWQGGFLLILGLLVVINLAPVPIQR